MWRHCKVICFLGQDAAGVGAAAGIQPEAPGVITTESAAEAADALTDLLSLHRVWHRFTPVST